ncbi:MAG: prepilin-type N-terminal cleavage/methylation domain-containing protein [Enterocloster asparagiformis]|nr:prepilin-type N-terminal cleavage/methylation domain-containing protein [Enterocloster asparagiformis]
MARDTEGRGRRCAGFTLLETVMALAIAAVALLFFTGFLAPQLRLYYRFGRASEAKQACSRSYRELEEQLRYGYDFYVDPLDSGILHYRVRHEIPSEYYRSGGDSALEFDAAKLEGAPELGMRLELDFAGTDEDTVCVRIRVLEAESGSVICEQEAYILSMYGDTVQEEKNGEKR